MLFHIEKQENSGFYESLSSSEKFTSRNIWRGISFRTNVF